MVVLGLWTYFQQTLLKIDGATGVHNLTPKRDKYLSLMDYFFSYFSQNYLIYRHYFIFLVNNK